MFSFLCFPLPKCIHPAYVPHACGIYAANKNVCQKVLATMWHHCKSQAHFWRLLNCLQHMCHKVGKHNFCGTYATKRKLVQWCTYLICILIALGKSWMLLSLWVKRVKEENTLKHIYYKCIYYIQQNPPCTMHISCDVVIWWTKYVFIPLTKTYNVKKYTLSILF